MIILELTDKMIEEVYARWEAEHPGQTARDMPSEEFARQLWAEMMKSARSEDA